MSFPKYPEYKESDTPWIDTVPKSWDVIQAKRGIEVLTDFTANGSFASLSDNVDYKSSGYARLIRMTDLRYQLEQDGVWVDERAYRYLRKSALHGGELLMASVGSVGLVYLMPKVDYPATLAPNMYLLKTNKFLFERYFYWFLLSSGGQDQISQAATVTAQPKLNKDNVRSLVLPLPSEDEQFKISSFLNHETARIDALVEEQQRLIELLKEKRQAVISHAVTKGLDPDVPMKDSGVEWLGEVPTHWELGGLTKFIGPVVDYRGRTPKKVDDGIFLVTAKNVRNGRIDYEASREYADPESARSLLGRGKPEIGDLLFTMEAPLGQVALIDRTDIALAQRIVKFRGVEGVMVNSYLMYWLMSTGCQARMETLATGSTALGIKASKLGMIECLAPPVAEQEEIVGHIERESAKHDVLLSEAQINIDLLQERRSALISAAVTGKIDVRGWQPRAGLLAPAETTQTEAV